MHCSKNNLYNLICSCHLNTQEQTNFFVLDKFLVSMITILNFYLQTGQQWRSMGENYLYFVGDSLLHILLLNFKIKLVVFMCKKIQTDTFIASMLLRKSAKLLYLRKQ